MSRACAAHSSTKCSHTFRTSSGNLCRESSHAWSKNDGASANAAVFKNSAMRLSYSASGISGFRHRCQKHLADYFADLIEEKRAPIVQLEASGFVAERAGE